MRYEKELGMDYYQNLTLIVIASVGFIYLFKSMFNLILFLISAFFRPPKNLKRYGSWAVITGCTDGIGKALAFELASKGLNLVLIGRSPTKLESTSNEIKERYGHRVEIKNVSMDFCKIRGEEISKILVEVVRDIDVGILINNAGLAYLYARFFHEVDFDLLENVIRVNVEGMTFVTKAVIARMLEKKKGAIVNIGSGSSGVTSSYPLYSVYAATKSYIAMLSRSLALEYKSQGIDIQCQIPLLVATKMAAIKKSSFFIPTPNTFSKASARHIGFEKICLPYWPHNLQGFLLQMLPEFISDWCLYHYFLGMRMRGMKRDANVAKGWNNENLSTFIVLENKHSSTSTCLNASKMIPI